MSLLLAAGVVSCLLVAPLYVIYKPPNFLIQHAQKRWPDVLWHVNTSRKIVALTIDDSPSQHTKQIVEILKANDATATFFVIGSQVSGHEKDLEELVRNGNELANHAMHDEPSVRLSDGDLAQQIMTVQTQIAAAYHAVGVAQPERRYFRPGGGFFSTRMRALLERLGYVMALGDIYPHDPFVFVWQINASHILSMIRPGGVIVCHDRRSWTPPMLQMVLPEMTRRGYRVVTLTELVQETKRQ